MASEHHVYHLLFLGGRKGAEGKIIERRNKCHEQMIEFAENHLNEHTDLWGINIDTST